MDMPLKNYPGFAKNFANLVQKSGLTQKEVGKRLGLSQQVISFYMNGKREPETIELTLKIAKFFRVSLYELTGAEVFKGVENTGAVPDDLKEYVELFEKLTEKERNEILDYMIFKIQQKK